MTSYLSHLIHNIFSKDIVYLRLSQNMNISKSSYISRSHPSFTSVIHIDKADEPYLNQLVKYYLSKIRQERFFTIEE